MIRQHRFVLGFLLGTFICIGVEPPNADAINFNFTYDAANSTAPASINDPNGQQLLAMMDDVGDMWADLIEDPWTINVEVRWQVPTLGNNFSGQMTPFQNHPGNTNGDPAEQNNRIVWALIRMNPNRTWWVDPTPTNHSEFDMTQTLYRDLSNSQQTAWYADGNDPVPDLLEVGYIGFPNATAPAVMQNNNTRDLMTVAVHEVGHTVGIGGTQAAGNETNDGKYDIDPQFVRGADFDAFSENATGNAHLNPSTTGGSPVLMCRCRLGGIRRLPSAIDVMAGATTANWTDIDLNHQDFLGGNSWHTDFNWEGGQRPLSLDHASVRHGGTVTLGGIGNVLSLLVDEDSTVQTSTQSLFADFVTIQKTAGGGTPRIVVNNFGDLNSETITVSDGARLDVLGGQVNVDRLNVLEGGELRGNGLVDIPDVVGELVNDGIIRASGGELVITSDNNLALDLDGEDGDGQVIATAGDIRFESALTDTFNGDMTVGAGHEIALNSGGSIGAGGLLLLDGSTTQVATVSGSILFVEQNGVIRADDLGVVENTLILQPSSIAETADANSELRLSGTTFYDGGRLLGTGTVRQNGDALVQQDTDILVATYDMDGQAGNTTITIDPDVTLDINSTSLDATGDNDFDGTLELNGGILDIERAWQLNGTMNMTETNGSPAIV